MQPAEAVAEIIKAVEAVLEEGGLNQQQLTFVQTVHRNSQELLSRYATLPKLESALRYVLPSVSYEMKAVLVSIGGYAQMLSDYPDHFGGELSPKQAESMRFVSRQAQALSNWCQNIIDNAHKEIRDQYEAVPQACQLSEILQHCEAVLSFTLQWSKRPIQLSFTYPDNLPPIFAAAYHLSHLIEHIVTVMAFELVEYGKIQISAELESNFVNLRIFCTGIGSSNAEIESLFVKEGRHVYRQRFEQQGGRIEFSREAGLGAAVHLLIAIAKN